MESWQPWNSLFFTLSAQLPLLLGNKSTARKLSWSLCCSIQGQYRGARYRLLPERESTFLSWPVSPTSCPRLGQSSSLTQLRICCYEVPCNEDQISSHGLGYLQGIPVLMWLQETKFSQVKLCWGSGLDKCMLPSGQTKVLGE